MRKKFKFNPMFGLKLRDRLDGTFYSILILVVLLFSAVIFRLATFDYQKLQVNVEQKINYKYKEFITRLIVNEVKKVEPDIQSINQLVVPKPVEIENRAQAAPALTENLSKLKAARQKIARRVEAQNDLFKNMKTIGVTSSGYTSDLPEVNDFFDEDITPLEDVDEIIDRISSHPPKPEILAQGGRAGVTNLDPGDITSNNPNLFNYVIERKGSAYLDVPEQLVKEPLARKQGYRDPDEVERVVQKYSPMIDYCFRKHTRYSPNTRGFIKVAFKISYEGYVIPESVRIVSSSIKNKPLEQCIKNFIKHWSSFKRLDQSMGIAQVVQKFVFN